MSLNVCDKALMAMPYAGKAVTVGIAVFILPVVVIAIIGFAADVLTRLNPDTQKGSKWVFIVCVAFIALYVYENPIYYSGTVGIYDHFCPYTQQNGGYRVN